jgi:hypothetical protein
MRVVTVPIYLPRMCDRGRIETKATPIIVDTIRMIPRIRRRPSEVLLFPAVLRHAAWRDGVA